jgi:diguanylate cyclase
MSMWSSWDRRRRIFAIAALVVVLASIAYALILRNGWFGDRAVTAIDDIGEAVAAAIASAACAWAVSRAHGREALGWALMSISTGLWAAGEVVWSINEVGFNVTPYPSLADAGFLSAVPFAIGGIRSFWSGAARGTSTRWRVWFDGVIVAIALTSTAWAFGLRTVWESESSTKLLDLAYPVSDIVVGTVLILAIRRATHQQAGRMALLLLGVSSYSIADSAFAYLSAQNTFASVGHVLNTGWFAGFLMIALAAIYPAGEAKVATRQASLDLWQLALPWMTLLLASAGDVYSALSGHELDLFMSSLTATLAVLLTVNMIVERREFLEMLTEIQSSHVTLQRDFRTALVEVRRLSRLIRDSERFDADEVRRLAADIHRVTDRLDDMVEDILDTEVEGANLELGAEVPVSTGAVAAVTSAR